MSRIDPNSARSSRRTNVTPDELAEMARRAVELHQRGLIAEASSLYERVLAADPTHADALHLSGVIALTRGDRQKGVQRISRALAIHPTNAVAHFNLGVALHDLKDLEGALASYDRALAHDPALAPALSNRGLILKELGRFEAALESLERAVTIAPSFAEAHFNKGVVLDRLQRPGFALASYDRALAIRPDYSDALCNRGNVLAKLNRREEAVASFDLAIRANPRDIAAHISRGNVLKDLERRDEALASYDAALAINGHDVDALCNRGVLLYESREIEQAIAAFERALALRPDFPAARQYRGYALLLNGDLESGFADHEWRWANVHGPLARERRSFEQALWVGAQAIANKRILLHAEQGFGDTLQFCRYVKWVADLGATVILETPRPLASLLASLEGVTELIVRDEEPLPAFDYHCPLMSLPVAFATNLGRIPARVPYLASDSRKVGAWQGRLGERRRFRVGVVWSGGFRPNCPELWPLDRRRNIPLEKLSGLAHPEVDFYSLQKGDRAESELAELIAGGWKGLRLIDFTRELRDFSDTAALLSNLDLLISVDTAAAHLAGALGKPVWVLNRFDACWRWLLERNDSPWYPSARLYRQGRPGDWDCVVSKVGADLRAKVTAG